MTEYQKMHNGMAHEYEYGLPITVGDDVRIASNVTVCGGRQPLQSHPQDHRAEQHVQKSRAGLSV